MFNCSSRQQLGHRQQNELLIRIPNDPFPPTGKVVVLGRKTLETFRNTFKEPHQHYFVQR